ncbi:SGNH/GDSL hydrolase family protein ['Paenibacillus yunnanensis' Narsing Rao et al. 2020]|uniref:SGNH/GDSL hydrolase family protein n=1 Tax=Paenibacillus tengchongensis TaxID=2608684 RepID=UPI00124EB6BF|nr:SGNH/GDSL hydrolase family protein [Paenibacillus tengchongensis]
MGFVRRVITSALDLANLAKHNDNFADIETDLTAQDGRIATAQADITTHKSSVVAHAAETITYAGAVAGVDNAKDAIDSVKEQLNGAIIGGDSGPEAAAARASVSGTTYPTLGDRLNAEYEGVTAQLADAAQVNYLVKTILKIKNKQNLRIAIMGDSLAVPSGSGVNWVQMLLDHTYASFGYNLHDLYGVTAEYVQNYAILGHTSHLLCAQIASEMRPMYNHGFYQNQNFNAPYLGMAPFFKENYDLVIVSIGANGGTDHKAYTENFLRMVRAAGVEVILTTANPRRSNLAAYADLLPDYTKLASALGFEIADTRQAFIDDITAGNHTINQLTADDIHCAQPGHELYAQTIIGVLDKCLRANINGQGSLPARRILPTSSTTLDANMPFFSALQRPVSHTGTLVTSTYDIKNPFYNRQSATLQAVHLTAGQYVEFCNEKAFAFDIIFSGNGLTAEMHVLIESGLDPWPPITLGNGVVYGGPLMAEGVQSYIYNNDNPINRLVRLQCVSGSIDIIGVSWLTQPDKPFFANQNGFSNTEYNGTWTILKEFGVYGSYTDTDQDSLEFTIYSDALELTVLGNQAGGKYDVYVDNLLIASGVDTYVNHNYENFFHNHLYKGLGRGKHTVRIKLNGVNGAAIAPSDADFKHRLKIARIKEVFINDDVAEHI